MGIKIKIINLGSELISRGFAYLSWHEGSGDNAVTYFAEENFFCVNKKLIDIGWSKWFKYRGKVFHVWNYCDPLAPETKKGKGDKNRGEK